MRRLAGLLLITIVTTVAQWAMAADSRVKDGRYYASNGEFSVEAVTGLKSGKEWTAGSTFVVDFVWSHPSYHGWDLYCSVMWIPISQPVPWDQYRDYALQIAGEFIASRISAKSDVALEDSQTMADDRPPSVTFIARSQRRLQPGVSQAAELWGVVLFFDDRIAFVSQLNLGGFVSDTKRRLTVNDIPRDFRDWAHSLRREI
jgi:hypothetical protein